MRNYRIDTEERAKEMEAAFPQLYYRVKQLEERLISHFLRGNTQCLVSYGLQTRAPCFSAVSFEEGPAEKYEAHMRRFFSTYKNTTSSALPRPNFSVRVEVDFGGARCETFEFAFAAYCDETVLAFCKEVEACAADRFRHRFSNRNKQTGL